MKIRLILATALFAVAALFPAPVSAAERIAEGTSNCTAFVGSLPIICLSEDANTNSGHDKLLSFGGADWSNLQTKAHTLPGLCNAAVTVGDDWNDCVSYLWAKLGPGQSVCFYEDSGFAGGSVIAEFGNPTTSTRVVTARLDTTGFNDDLTGFKVFLTTANPDCTAWD